jgi:hypothetical protein
MTYLFIAFLIELLSPVVVLPTAYVAQERPRGCANGRDIPELAKGRVQFNNPFDEHGEMMTDFIVLRSKIRSSARDKRNRCTQNPRVVRGELLQTGHG